MELQNNEPVESVVLDELSDFDEEIDKRVLFEVYHALMNKTLVVPSLPDIAIRIREAANDDNVSVDGIARIIQADASTAAYCINVANNAATAGVSAVDNVHDAVVRMGIQPTRDSVVAYTVRSLFSGSDPASNKLMRAAWRHSCRIAALSYILARDVARLNAERALLAGLLHDIGVTILIKEVQKYPGVMADVLVFNRVVRELSGQIGAMVLRTWEFPDAFPAAAMEAELFERPAEQRLQIADVVMLAHLHDRAPAPWSLPTKKLNLSELPVHKKLVDCDLTDDCLLAAVAEAEKELSELMTLLGS